MQQERPALTDRHVLYGLVAAGLHVISAIVIVAAAALVPWWMTALLGVVWAGALARMVAVWRTGIMAAVKPALLTSVAWLLGIAIGARFLS